MKGDCNVCGCEEEAHGIDEDTGEEYCSGCEECSGYEEEEEDGDDADEDEEELEDILDDEVD